MGITDISLPSMFVLYMLIYIFSTPSLSFIQQDSFKENSLQIYIKKKNPSISFSVYGTEDKTFSLSNLLSAISGDSSLSVSHIFNDLFGRRENEKRKGNLLLGKFKFSFLFSVLFSK